MTHLGEHSKELADELDIPEPEAWGFLTAASAKGWTKERAFEVAKEEYENE
jgi:hypothetical protein